MRMRYKEEARLGDIIGSPFEFDRGDKTKEFELFTRGGGYTDDSVMTIAVGEALLDAGREAGAEENKEFDLALIGVWYGKFWRQKSNTRGRQCDLRRSRSPVEKRRG